MAEKHDNNEIEVLEPEVLETEVSEPEIEEYNASFDPDPIPGMSEDELQDSILADSNMNSFQRFIAKLDDRTWTIYQRILGVILGLGACVALFWNSGRGEDESGFTWTLVIAIVIAMLIPNIIEKQAQRKIAKARVTEAITMGIFIVVYFVYMAITKGL